MSISGHLWSLKCLISLELICWSLGNLNAEVSLRQKLEAVSVLLVLVLKLISPELVLIKVMLKLINVKVEQVAKMGEARALEGQVSCQKRVGEGVEGISSQMGSDRFLNSGMSRAGHITASELDSSTIS